MKRITVYSKEYPMRITMGAMLRFKRETNRDVSEIGADVSLMVVFLFCCVASACNADGLGMDVLNEFAGTLQEDAGDSKKKPATTSLRTSTN